MSNDQYRHIHTPSTSEGVYITFNYRGIEDETSDPKDYLFQDPDYKSEDQARLDAWHNGEWGFIGIRAVASIQVTDSAGQSTLYEIESAGLWGIESDCGLKYKQEVFQEEIAELKNLLDMLAAGKNIQYAYGNAA